MIASQILALETRVLKMGIGERLRILSDSDRICGLAMSSSHMGKFSVQPGMATVTADSLLMSVLHDAWQLKY